MIIGGAAFMLLPDYIPVWGARDVFDDTGKLAIDGPDAGRVEFWRMR